MAQESSRDSNRIHRRDLALVVILGIVTLSIYNFYLVYQWAKELNGLEGRTKYNPSLMLIISIVTVGAGAAIIECVFAHEVENHAQTRNIAGATPYLTVFVSGLNIVAWILFFTSYWIIGIPAGITATVLIQRELNMFAQ